MKACGMPGPVSLTLMTMKRDFGLSVATSSILPCSVNLTAFKKTHDISLARSRSSTAYVVNTYIAHIRITLTKHRLRNRRIDRPFDDFGVCITF